jgi:hypothetical protein
MIAAVAWTRITFEDVPLTDLAPAHVINVLSAVLACGFWYARDDAPWFEDVLIGPKHVQDFKHAPKSALRRRVIARFEAVTKEIDGDLMTAPDVAAYYAHDAIFRRRCEALPKFEGIRRKLTEELPNHSRRLCAEQYDRQLIVPMHGSLDLKHLLAAEYEG